MSAVEADPCSAGATPQETFYRRAVQVLAESGVPFLIGGAYALAQYTGIVRDSKDLDVFVTPAGCPRALAALECAGFRTEVPATHWLAKTFCGNDFVDIIFGSGNGVCTVDEGWFAHARKGEILGIPVRYCPAEELIWSKAFIMERERYDGADIAHVLRVCGRQLDWPRLLARFGPHWRVLLSHLVLFGFVYPAEREAIPDGVLQQLLGRLARDTADTPTAEPVCHGTLLSNAQYLVDLRHWGYRDARLAPEGPLTAQQVAGALATISGADRRVRVRRQAPRAPRRRRERRRA